MSSSVYSFYMLSGLCFCLAITCMGLTLWGYLLRGFRRSRFAFDVLSRSFRRSGFVFFPPSEPRRRREYGMASVARVSSSADDSEESSFYIPPEDSSCDLETLTAATSTTSFSPKYHFSRSKRIGYDDATNTCIYAGWDAKTKEDVVVKVAPSSDSQTFNEQQIWRHLQRLGGFQGLPCLRDVFPNHGENHERILVVDRLGLSLEAVRRKRPHRPFAADELASVAYQALNLLEHLHRLGYAHRDVKPANLMLGRADPERLYLIDFGVAERLPSLSKKQSANGTHLFSSSGAAFGTKLGRRDDIESLVYTLLALARDGGDLPWRDEADALHAVSGTRSCKSALSRLGRAKRERTPPAISELDARTARVLSLMYEHATSTLSADDVPDYVALRAACA